ncbi:dentin sialophosphoprotein-like [Leptopilina boulardi]|uniref:dentin sialophosphoprotein-like n=1 Tax=Leptopilina boulardi TaxID=63433 RepID=UPI0021F644E4|nr:dentin sialophosphoprotein-like [Leptopilina boulardi]
MKTNKVYKTPRTCGFSNRHFRRIIKKKVKEEIDKHDSKEKKTETNQPDNEKVRSSEDARSSEGDTDNSSDGIIDDFNQETEDGNENNINDEDRAEDLEQGDNCSVNCNEYFPTENDVIDTETSSGSENSYMSDSEDFDKTSDEDEDEENYIDSNKMLGRF